MLVNSAGRELPGKIKGYKDVIPYTGPFTVEPEPQKAAAWTGGRARPGDNKLLPDIAEAIRRCGLEDGMTISFHHHFRNGDAVVNAVMETVSSLGIRELKVAISSVFPVHAPLVDYMRRGTVTRLSCNFMNGPVAEAACRGEFPFPIVFRTHGGRDRAIEAGEEKIDVAFIGAPAADPAGNFNGVSGPLACGSLGYCLSDSRYARKVVVLTDHLLPYPLVPTSADESEVDYVVRMERVGDPAGITTGAVRMIRDPLGLTIAAQAAKVIAASGLLQDGVSFQTGTGGVSLAVARFLRKRMEQSGVGGSFGLGGITSYLVELLQDGFFKCLLDTQTFDLPSIHSLRDNPRHVEISSSRYANIHAKGCAVNSLDIMLLSAIEVDTAFNVNAHTASNGLIIGGSGGHADTAAGAKLAIVVTPAWRGRLPIIVDRVVTLTTPGETVDCVVTELGIAVNPRRADLRERLVEAGLPVKEIHDLKAAIERVTGRPRSPALAQEIIGVVEYRNGSVIDVIHKMAD